MILTEEEARTKRCQESYAASDGVAMESGVSATAAPALTTYSVAASYGGAGVMALRSATAPLNCIASNCMAWRWFDNVSDQAIKQPRGYCGKAGCPS